MEEISEDGPRVHPTNHRSLYTYMWVYIMKGLEFNLFRTVNFATLFAIVPL